MRNKLLMLPISGGAGNAPTINQCQVNMETLMDTALKRFQDGMEVLMDATNDLPDDMLLDSGVSDASAENWERYKQIVRGIFRLTIPDGACLRSSIGRNPAWYRILPT